ncbi:peroxidase-like [Aphis craccivora]|uniref:Peroxidase-like n=1 Tax=Aphis craccivora TaxID=307492 RepID=A0A6G0YLB8_APHCR|nr:peroxidase-like [Aphis craccivora]
MLSFIIGRMNSSISIQLLICLLIFLPSYCRGYDDPCKSQDPRVFIKTILTVLAPNYEDWYMNLTIGVIEEEIRKNMDRIQYNRFTEDYVVSQISDHLKIGSSPFRGQLLDSSLSKEANLEYRNAELLVAVSRSIMSSYCPTYQYTRAISVQQCAEDLSKMEVSKTSLRDMCSEYFNERRCIEKDLRYRSIDGSCNNLIHSYLGKATTAYKRLLFPDYVDGIQEVSERLPNARKVSVGLVCDEESFDNKKTMAMAIWGIFIGHDLSRTAASTMGNNNTFVRCCGDNGLIHYTMNKYVKSCNPITIPNDDAFYEPKLQSCMDYVRSVPAMRSDCTFGHIDQVTVILLHCNVYY